MGSPPDEYDGAVAELTAILGRARGPAGDQAVVREGSTGPHRLERMPSLRN